MKEIIVHSSPAALSDSQLYQLCQLYGGNAKSWLRKFAGLLPEVYKRRLHRKHGCTSIQEFAKKLAGMNEATVDKILNLHRKLQNKPALLALLESGEQGWSKLEKVAYIATLETDKELAKKVETLPQKALELYVQNIRDKSGGFTLKSETRNIFQITPWADQNGQQTPNPTAGQPSLPQIADSTVPQNIFQIEPAPQEPTFTESAEQHSTPAPYTTFSFSISPNSRQKLNFIKNQLEKDYKKTLTWDEVIKFWPLKTQKTIIQKVCPTCAESASKKINASRHIPAAVKNLIFAIHGEKCAYPNCTQPYHELHHTKPYAIYKNHDPNYIYPLCKTHHLLSHAGLIANQHLKPEHWYIRDKAIQSEIDKKVMHHHDARSFTSISQRPPFSLHPPASFSPPS